ncbi:uncharacterized protein [Nicotiana sylvestris]|uniref:uncharacterized protein n=1 Tax=Nicotiana sylvestris TaxID=4096 RepID=UPI00388C5B47
MGSLEFISAKERPLASDIQSLANRLVRFNILEPSRVFACVVAQSSLLGQIKARQFEDPHLAVLSETVLQGSAKEVSIGEDGVLRLQGRLCVHNIDGLRERILEEAHSSRYSIYPYDTKMYHDVRQYYWWQRMKKDIVELTKSAHFIPVMTTYSSERLAQIYIWDIFWLHGVPVSIISDRGF